MPGGNLQHLLLECGNWHKPAYKRVVYVDCSGDVFAVIFKYLATGFAVATEKAPAEELQSELAYYFTDPPDILVPYNPSSCDGLIENMIRAAVLLGFWLVYKKVMTVMM